MQKPHKLSRSKIDLFLECPRCFWLDQVKKIKRPSIPAFTLNSAVDELLKKEFDILRKNGQKHALMEKYGIEAIPYNHPELPKWRNNFVGMQFLHKPTNILLFGAIDDVWVSTNPDLPETLHIVDYKSTSTSKEISLDDEYKQGYKIQMEFYQWLFKMNGLFVSDIGYFVFANGLKSNEKFDGKLEFELSILEHTGNDYWVESTIYDIRKCLDSPDLPESSAKCDYCKYRDLVQGPH